MEVARSRRAAALEKWNSDIAAILRARHGFTVLAPRCNDRIQFHDQPQSSETTTMKPGPKPTPPHLRLLRGNPGRLPYRPTPQPKRGAEPPPPPDYLSELAQAEWRRIAPELWRLGVLTVLDLALLAVYVDALERWRAASRLLAQQAAANPESQELITKTPEGRRQQNPLLRIQARQAELVRRLGSELGLSPAARTSLVAAPPSGGKFDGLLGG
jgi:P27 family predicted phage terminase small subunit